MYNIVTEVIAKSKQTITGSITNPESPPPEPKMWFEKISFSNFISKIRSMAK